MPTKRKTPAKKKSPPGDNNWLRKFYQLCGFDSERAELAITRRNKEAPPSLVALDKPISTKANVKRNIGGQ
jgi:hypothetical protein